MIIKASSPNDAKMSWLNEKEKQQNPFIQRDASITKHRNTMFKSTMMMTNQKNISDHQDEDISIEEEF